MQYHAILVNQFLSHSALVTHHARSPAKKAAKPKSIKSRLMNLQILVFTDVCACCCGASRRGSLEPSQTAWGWASRVFLCHGILRAIIHFWCPKELVNKKKHLHLSLVRSILVFSRFSLFTSLSLSLASKGRQWKVCFILKILLNRYSTLLLILDIQNVMIVYIYIIYIEHRNISETNVMQTLHFNSFWSSCHLSKTDRNKSKKVTTTTQAPGICMFWYRKGFHVGKQALEKLVRDGIHCYGTQFPLFLFPYSALVLKEHGTRSHFRISQLQ